MGRDKNQRTALFKNLVQALIFSGQIKTTEAKAKAIKGLVDKLITQVKSPTTRRLVSQFLSKQHTDRLVNELLPRLQNRNSGYTSTIKMGRRLGDNTMIVSMSLLVNAAPAKNQISEIIAQGLATVPEESIGTDEEKTATPKKIRKATK